SKRSRDSAEASKAPTRVRRGSKFERSKRFVKSARNESFASGFSDRSNERTPSWRNRHRKARIRPRPLLATSERSILIYHYYPNPQRPLGSSDCRVLEDFG